MNLGLPLEKSAQNYTLGELRKLKKPRKLSKNVLKKTFIENLVERDFETGITKTQLDVFKKNDEIQKYVNPEQYWDERNKNQVPPTSIVPFDRTFNAFNQPNDLKPEPLQSTPYINNTPFLTPQVSQGKYRFNKIPTMYDNINIKPLDKKQKQEVGNIFDDMKEEDSLMTIGLKPIKTKKYTGVSKYKVDKFIERKNKKKASDAINKIYDGALDKINEKKEEKQAKELEKKVEKLRNKNLLKKADMMVGNLIKAKKERVIQGRNLNEMREVEREQKMQQKIQDLTLNNQAKNITKAINTLGENIKAKKRKDLVMFELKQQTGPKKRGRKPKGDSEVVVNTQRQALASVNQGGLAEAPQTTKEGRKVIKAKAPKSAEKTKAPKSAEKKKK